MSSPRCAALSKILARFNDGALYLVFQLFRVFNGDERRPVAAETRTLTWAPVIAPTA